MSVLKRSFKAMALDSAAPPPTKKRTRTQFRLRKVISGGQTGADRAALEAARSCHIPTGGTAPPGFQTSGGVDLALRDKFHLTELRSDAEWERVGVEVRGTRWLASEYRARSMRNVDAADATIAFCLRNSPGTVGTINYCCAGKWTTGGIVEPPIVSHRPCLVVRFVDGWETVSDNIVMFLIRHRPRVLNVCGHRNDETAGMAGFAIAVCEILKLAFKKYRAREKAEAEAAEAME